MSLRRRRFPSYRCGGQDHRRSGSSLCRRSKTTGHLRPGNGRQIAGNEQEFLAVHFLKRAGGQYQHGGRGRCRAGAGLHRLPEPEMDAVASKGMQQARVDGAGGKDFPMSRYLLNRLPGSAQCRALLTGAGAVREQRQPGLQSDGHSEGGKRLKEDPLVVSFSAFMDETAAMAHYILPNHVYLERFEDVPAAQSFPRPIIGLVKPVTGRFSTPGTPAMR